MKKNLNMRDWIDTLEKSGELITLSKPVDPLTEMGALLYKSRDKCIFFKDIAGFPGWRALGQAPANVGHAALAFDTPPENLYKCRCRDRSWRYQDGP